MPYLVPIVIVPPLSVFGAIVILWPLRLYIASNRAESAEKEPEDIEAFESKLTTYLTSPDPRRPPDPAVLVPINLRLRHLYLPL